MWDYNAFENHSTIFFLLQFKNVFFSCYLRVWHLQYLLSECQRVTPVLEKSPTVISSSPLMVLLSPGVGVAGADSKLIQNLLPSLGRHWTMKIPLYRHKPDLLWAHPWHSGCLVVALHILLSAVCLAHTIPGLLVVVVSRVGIVTSLPHQLLMTSGPLPSSSSVLWFCSWLC